MAFGKLQVLDWINEIDIEFKVHYLLSYLKPEFSRHAPEFSTVNKHVFEYPFDH